MEELQPQEMCCLFIMAETEFSKRITRILDDMSLYHTNFGEGSGTGRHGRREDTDVWPGANTALFVALPDDTIATEIVRRVEQDIEENYRKRPGFAAFKMKGIQIA